jgi:nucleotide-binding universal stress UspA family protein
VAHQPTVICPVDFSEPSRSALRYAAAIAEHFGARCIVLTVDDPLLESVAASTGRVSLTDETREELRQFIADTLGHTPGFTTIDLRVAVGKPAPEILATAKAEHADLIVMSSHGRSGLSKRFLGSTTERVLRETRIPVFVAPKADAVATSLSEIGREIHAVVAPVDLTAASSYQLTVASGIASALSVPLIAVHVVEPVFLPRRVRAVIAGSDLERRAESEARLRDLISAAASQAKVEVLVVTGDPSEEIVKIAQSRRARLIVMGLHSSELLGPRMGSVTYRVLSLSDALVLALPPSKAPAAQSRTS